MTSLQDFQILQKIGDGSYSVVYKVKRLKDNQQYALKKVRLQNLNRKEQENALNEVRILASISHINIISYKEAFLDDASQSLCIVMEYANNGDLFQKISKHQKMKSYVKEYEIWNIIIQTVQGLKALHDKKIYHRDIKSANVFMFADGIVKIGDMNVSKIAKNDFLKTQTGTPYYASPEVWKDKPYNSKSDIWSLGCVIYELCSLRPPFQAQDMQGLYRKVISGNIPNIPQYYSFQLNTFVKSLLSISPKDRPNGDQILSSPLVQQHMNNTIADLNLDQDSNINLLNTIKVPKNIQFLSKVLPKPNYAEKCQSFCDKENEFNHEINQEKQNSVKPMKKKLTQKKYSLLPAIRREEKLLDLDNEKNEKVLPAIQKPKNIYVSNLSNIQKQRDDKNARLQSILKENIYNNNNHTNHTNHSKLLSEQYSKIFENKQYKKKIRELDQKYKQLLKYSVKRQYSRNLHNYPNY